MSIIIKQIKKVCTVISVVLVVIGALVLVCVHINWTWIQREAWTELIINTIPQFVKDIITSFMEAKLYEKGMAIFVLGIMLLLISQLEGNSGYRSSYP